LKPHLGLLLCHAFLCHDLLHLCRAWQRLAVRPERTAIRPLPQLAWLTVGHLVQGWSGCKGSKPARGDSLVRACSEVGGRHGLSQRPGGRSINSFVVRVNQPTLVKENNSLLRLAD
jgi:hypothetical protein